VAAYPAWTGSDGFPLSWAHYVYGLDRLRLRTVRDQLRTAQAQRSAGTEQADWDRWQNERLRLIDG
jgi:hypothetical protein